LAEETELRSKATTILGGLLLLVATALFTVRFDPWRLGYAAAVFLLVSYAVHMFEKEGLAWKVTAVILVPALLWRFFLPKELKRRLRELQEQERQTASS
jgi:hypothetical protein